MTAVMNSTPWRSAISRTRVRIEAKGYLPVTSPAYANDAGDQVFDARLIQGAWLEGVVRGTDGAPLRGAEVILVTLGEGIHIGGGKTYQRGYHPSPLDRTRRPVLVLTAGRPLSPDRDPR